MIRFLKKCWAFIISLPYLIMETFLWLFFSYGILLGNIIIIKGIQHLPFTEIIERPDVLNNILTTTVCFLVGIIYMMYCYSSKSRRLFFAFAIGGAFVAAAWSIIMIIQIELNWSFFDTNYIRYGMIGSTIAAIMLALISKYDETKVNDQKYANNSRDIDTVSVDGRDLNI